jgi:hypothetical protein
VQVAASGEHLASLPHDLPPLCHLQEIHAQLLKQGMHHCTSELVASYVVLRQVPACRRVFSAAFTAAFSGSLYKANSSLLANTPSHTRPVVARSVLVVLGGALFFGHK